MRALICVATLTALVAIVAVPVSPDIASFFIGVLVGVVLDRLIIPLSIDLSNGFTRRH